MPDSDKHSRLNVVILDDSLGICASSTPVTCGGYFPKFFSPTVDPPSPILPSAPAPSHQAPPSSTPAVPLPQPPTSSIPSCQPPPSSTPAVPLPQPLTSSIPSCQPPPSSTPAVPYLNLQPAPYHLVSLHPALLQLYHYLNL